MLVYTFHIMSHKLHYATYNVMNALREKDKIFDRIEYASHPDFHHAPSDDGPKTDPHIRYGISPVTMYPFFRLRISHWQKSPFVPIKSPQSYWIADSVEHQSNCYRFHFVMIRDRNLLCSGRYFITNGNGVVSRSGMPVTTYSSGRHGIR